MIDMIKYKLNNCNIIGKAVEKHVKVLIKNKSASAVKHYHLNLLSNHTCKDLS